MEEVQPRRHADAAGASAAGKTVVLHIGAPKTGTTFLQQVLWHNRDALARQGVGYPLAAPREHFAATMDLREATWGGRHEAEWDGAWDRVAARVRAWSGPRLVFSNELLGAATPEQVARALDSLQPAQVQVVFTLRDLARQLPSEWQEQVKHHKLVSFDELVDELVEQADVGTPPPGAMFWRLHDPIRVLRPWSEAIGPARVHVVTVPPAGASPDVLWHRFADVVGVDAGSCRLDVGNTNPSLGLVEAELLRQTNERGQVAGNAANPAQRRYFVRRVLGTRAAARRITLPARHVEWVRARSAELVEGIRSAGYPVVGDLADLQPEVSQPPPGINRVSEQELLDAALDALARLLARPAPSDAPAQSNRGGA